MLLLFYGTKKGHTKHGMKAINTEKRTAASFLKTNVKKDKRTPRTHSLQTSAFPFVLHRASPRSDENKQKTREMAGRERGKQTQKGERKSAECLQVWFSPSVIGRRPTQRNGIYRLFSPPHPPRSPCGTSRLPGRQKIVLGSVNAELHHIPVSLS